MNFKDMIKKEIKMEEKITIVETAKKDSSAEDILRNGGFKIRSIFGTKFGTEFLLMKKYPEKDIKEILKDFTIRIDAESVFVEK